MDETYLMTELRRDDRDRFLTVLLAPAAARGDLLALYTFNVEIARIPEGVSEPILGRMKVQWWRDQLTAIGEGRGVPAGHPGAVALERLVKAQPGLRPWLDEMLDARDEQLETPVFADMTALEHFGEKTAVRLAWASLHILGVNDDRSRAAAREAAMAHALTGLLRAVPFHLRRGLLAMPAELMAKHGVSTDGLASGKDRAAFCGVAADIAARARAYVDAARAMRGHLNQRGLAVFQWVTVASGVLDQLARASGDVFDARMLAYRTPLWPLMWRCWLGRF